MLALQGLGYTSLLVEAKPFSDKTTADFDARSLALSPASQRILNTLGLWDILKNHASPIAHIHVSDQSRFGVSRLCGTQANPLGYVVEMQYIHHALNQLLDQQHILAPAQLSAIDLKNQLATVTTPTGEWEIQAQLIVAADGADSPVRTFTGQKAEIKNYHQHAIVANIGLMKPHEQRAFERFTAHGPLALLPMQGNKMSLVWALPPADAERLMNCSEAEFLKELQLAFGYRLGRLVKVGRRANYPLKQVLTQQQNLWPVVFVGNAAHTLHPVAGQGFNLGLRDVATLAQCIAQRGLSESMLEHYLSLRRHDQQIITRFTDGLIDLFTSRLPGIAWLRNLGLLAFDNSPALKNLLARYARGFGGVTPDLVCDIALNSGELR